MGRVSGLRLELEAHAELEAAGRVDGSDVAEFG